MLLQWYNTLNHVCFLLMLQLFFILFRVLCVSFFFDIFTQRFMVALEFDFIVSVACKLAGYIHVLH